MIDRIIRVFKLDREVFAEVEHDASATSQAAIVIAIVAALSTVGSILQMLFSAVRGGGARAFGAALLGIVVTFIMAFVSWAIWSFVTYIVGTQLFKGEATFQEMLRVIGFASAPRMLSIIPCIGGIVGAIWSLIASYFAIKEGLDLDDTGTIVTILIGWLITVIVGFLVGLVTGVGAVGLGALTSALQ
jgi:hypothetical protein